MPAHEGLPVLPSEISFGGAVPLCNLVFKNIMGGEKSINMSEGNVF